MAKRKVKVTSHSYMMRCIRGAVKKIDEQEKLIKRICEMRDFHEREYNKLRDIYDEMMARVAQTDFIPMEDGGYTFCAKIDHRVLSDFAMNRDIMAKDIARNVEREIASAKFIHKAAKHLKRRPAYGSPADIVREGLL